MEACMAWPPSDNQRGEHLLSAESGTCLHHLTLQHTDTIIIPIFLMEEVRLREGQEPAWPMPIRMAEHVCKCRWCQPEQGFVLTHPVLCWLISSSLPLSLLSCWENRNSENPLPLHDLGVRTVIGKAKHQGTQHCPHIHWLQGDTGLLSSSLFCCKWEGNWQCLLTAVARWGGIRDTF